MRSKDDLPARAIMAISESAAEVMVDVAHDAVVDHERRMHVDTPLPGPRFDIPKEVPFQEQFIPDCVLRRIAERLSPSNEDANNEDLNSVAREFGYPALLVEREMYRFLGANRRFNIMLKG